MTHEPTAESVAQATREDLEGLNGDAARESTLLGLLDMLSHQMVDQIHFFGTQGARVRNVAGNILISNP